MHFVISAISYSDEPKEVQSLAEAQSSTLNAAYRTLLSPVQRAQYILAQHGLPSSETEKLEEPELIMEIMDARESLDDSTSVAEVEAVRSRNEGSVHPFIMRTLRCSFTGHR